MNAHLPAAYLDTLNDGQRAAVEHGVVAGAAAPGPPLLVIAGAGSGKTNTLAHRVAHLIVNGADPRRILDGLSREQRVAHGDGRGEEEVEHERHQRELDQRRAPVATVESSAAVRRDLRDHHRTPSRRPCASIPRRNAGM